MTTRYRRGRVSRSDEAAAIATSVAIGAGVAVVSWYFLRLFLGRDALSPSSAASTESDTRALPAGGSIGETED